jgi:cytochrome bd ubiquinol oxidase subunit II
MSLPTLMALGLGFTLTGYALFGGADFGAGVLYLTFRREPHRRAAIAQTIGPLWEAHHVWLIFSITILFSAFPAAFAALGTVLLAPFTLALIAIVIRGAAFGLRPDGAAPTPGHRLLGAAFGVASVLAPFLFGASAAGVAQISTLPRSTATPFSVPWTGLFGALVGLLAVAVCAHLAASFMTTRLQRADQTGPAERFRRRGLQTGTALLGLSLASLLAAAWKAPALWHRLTTAALPLLIVGLLALGASLYGLWRRHYAMARGATLLTAAAILWGWLIAQSPRLIGTRLTIHSAAATTPALAALAVAGGLVLLSVLPAFYLLYAIFARPSPEVTE